MNAPRGPKRVAARRVAELIINIHGDKALKDSDLAALFGISVSRLYAIIGRKLWHLQPKGFHKLSKTRVRGPLGPRPMLAFTQSGVILITSILGDEASLEIGMDIAYAMKTRRRSSEYKKAPSRRAKDPKKAESYAAARIRLAAARLRAMRRKVLH